MKFSHCFKKFSFIIFIFLLVFVAFGCQQKSSQPESKPAETTKPSEVTEEAKETKKEVDVAYIYYADSDAMFLWPFEYKIEETADPAEFVILKIFKGPAPDGYYLTAPREMKMPEVKVEGDVAIVDFDPSTIGYYPKGSTGENLFIYSIVNSLTKTLKVKAVKFTVGGKPEQIPGSNYDFSTQEFEFNQDIVGSK